MVDPGTVAAVGLNAVAAAVLARLALRSWRSARPSARSLSVLAGAMAVWGGLAGVQTALSIAAGPTAYQTLVTQVDPVISATDTVEFGATVGVPVLWLVYVYSYTGRDRWLTPLTAAPVVVGVAFLLSLLVFRSRLSPDEPNTATFIVGSLFVLLWLVVFAAFVYAVYLLARMARGRTRVTGLQVATLTTAVVAPYVGGGLVPYLLRLTGLVPPRLVTPLEGPTAGLLIAAGLLTAAVRSYPVLTGFPQTDAVARSRVVGDLQEPVVVLDYDDRVLDVNDAVRTRFSPDDPVSSPVGEVVPGIDDADLTAGATGTVTLRTDAGRRQFEFSVSPVGAGAATDAPHAADPDRRRLPRPRPAAPLARAVVLRDVTDRRTREQRLSVLNRVLRHNLRNDLDVVLAHADRIEDDRTRAAIRETATDLVALGRRARDVQRVMEECTEPPESVDVAALARSVVAEYETDGAATVEAVTPATLPVSTHSTVLQAVLEELVDNAVTHADGPTVEVRVSQPPDAAAAVAVADDGPGIPPRERAVLEGDRETQTEHATGIGLWFVAWAVTGLGGDLQFTENDPRGSVVTVRLYDTPLDAEADPAE
jgi:signal transduction histidine kinase